jgi:hypothetical protein
MYETGIGVAFLIWIFGGALLIASVNSRFERNLHKIGQRLSWLTLTPKPREPNDVNRPTWRSCGRFLFIVGLSLPLILLSWLYVLIWLCPLVYSKWQDMGAPASVREARWRMRNTDMTFDQIIRALMRAAEIDDAQYESYKGDLIRGVEERGVPYG